MRSRFVISAVLAIAVVSTLASVGRADAADTGGENTYANARASGGQLSVQAGEIRWTPPEHSSWATSAQPDPPAGEKPNPNQPYGCTYTADPQASQTLGAGGPTPGQWIIPTCAGPGVIDPMPPFWVTGAKHAAVTVQVAPVVVAEEAAKHLGLASPVIEMAPPDGDSQLVGVATWLWVNPATWHPVTASASAGAVTTTATATPMKVVWDMGDGSTITCGGPGTPYDPSAPKAKTNCSYTWSTAGTYAVTATVYWSVAWTAAGAAGGGTLGVQAGPVTAVTVHVVQSQAINTPGAGG
ncbi:MAG: hypothetical protein M0Z42_08015 [Actinomycetota bacterium]|jgi:hypothetical protein|nr:hypothetical protein [Actinomycetota bacterium]